MDDQDLVRAGVRALLEHSEDIRVVGEAGDGNSGYAMVREQRPHVVLMDVRMPAADGLRTTRRIVADPELAAVNVLVLTTFGDDENLFAALRAGAAGFVLKDTGAEELRHAVRVVAAGDALLTPAVTRRVMQAAARTPRYASPRLLDSLTDREREVLREVGLGRSNAEISLELRITPDTARTYVSRILAKLHARDRSQLVVLAYETGTIQPGQSSGRAGA
ncbi:MAG: response regulator [Actinomycetales bacterium]